MNMGLQTHTRYLSLVLVFAFCQIVGVMCATPDLALAQEEEVAVLAEEMPACPMDGHLMCPPSIISLADREAKQGWVLAVDPTRPVGTPGDILTIQVFMGSDPSPPCTTPLCVFFPVLRI